MTEMVKAFVLIKTEVGCERYVAEKLREIDGVTQADHTQSVYDVIATVEASDINEVAKIVVSRIQLTDHIFKTTTCPIGPQPSRSN